MALFGGVSFLSVNTRARLLIILTVLVLAAIHSPLNFLNVATHQLHARYATSNFVPLRGHQHRRVSRLFDVPLILTRENFIKKELGIFVAIVLLEELA